MASNATNKTPNYGLSQWIGTDKVRREDFNADNLIIDGALANKVGQETGKNQVIKTYSKTVHTDINGLAVIGPHGTIGSAGISVSLSSAVFPTSSTLTAYMLGGNWGVSIKYADGTPAADVDVPLQVMQVISL